MQALRDRLTHKLSEKTKKDKEKDGSTSLKSSTSADGKHTTLSDSHQHQGSASSSSIASNAASVNAQSAEKGIHFCFVFSCESKNRYSFSQIDRI